MSTLQSVRDEAKSALEQGDYEKALSLVDLIRSHFPKDFEAAELAGQLYLETGRLAEAKQAFEFVLQADPERILSRSALALLAEEDGNLDAALANFERAFDLNSSNHQLVAEISRLQTQLGHTRLSDPGSCRRAAAYRLYREGRYERAVPLLEVALRDDPDVAEIGSALVDALWHAGRQSEAEAAAKQLLERQPNCVLALAVAGSCGYQRGEESSLALLKRAAALEPGCTVARGLFAELGIAFPKVGPPAEIPEIQVSPEREVQSAPVSSSPPQAEEEGEWDDEEEEEQGPLNLPDAEAEGEWVRDRLRPGSSGRAGDAQLHLAFARSFEMRGEIAHALTEYRVALQMEASVAPMVEQAARSVVEMNPQDWRARWLLGDSLAVDGHFLKAVEQYLKVLKA